MIGSLRKKFILINMTLVSLVLIIVFASILFFNYQWLKMETNDVLIRIMQNQEGMAPPTLQVGDHRMDKREPMLPVFRVDLDTEGQLLSVTLDNIEVSEEMIAEVAERALEDEDGRGMLLDLGLRYLREEGPFGTRIVFADISREVSSMTNLFITLLLVGLGGLTAFFFISLFLANMALRPVQKAWDQQRQFVADASHELRTPLTVILANTDILLSHRQDTIEQQAKWIEYTEAEALRMKQLVEDLLFLAKSDTITVPMEPSKLNGSDALWNTLLPFESVAYEQGVAIQSEITPDIELQGDPGQLKQLFVILLDNACKYAGSGGTITVTFDSKHEQAYLSVNNTGEPIPEEQLDRIFERFYRVDSSRVRQEGGYGLGLAIAKTIVDNHRGQIAVESTADKGTTFTIRLPLKSVDFTKI